MIRKTNHWGKAFREHQEGKARTELTRDEFLAVTKGRKHDDERHESWGAVLMWLIGVAIYEEHQPDIGPCMWFRRIKSHD